MLTAWSTLTVDTSIESSPSSMVLTRAPASPRMIGRDEPAEKNDEFTPSCSASVSPSVALLMRSSVWPEITAMGWASSAAELSRSTPVTWISSSTCTPPEPSSCALTTPGNATDRPFTSSRNNLDNRMGCSPNSR